MGATSEKFPENPQAKLGAPACRLSLDPAWDLQTRHGEGLWGSQWQGNHKQRWQQESQKAGSRFTPIWELWALEELWGLVGLHSPLPLLVSNPDTAELRAKVQQGLCTAEQTDPHPQVGRPVQAHLENVGLTS